MEYSPSSTIETTDEDKDVYLYELNNLHSFNPLPPPPISDPYHPQPMHHHHQPSSQSSNGHQYHHQLHASHSLPHIQQHQMMHNQPPGSIGSVSNGSPISNRQNSIQSVNSYHIDNDSQNNPSIFSNANNSYTSIQDFDSSSLLYNLDYELGSFESIDSLNTPTPNQSFNTSFNNSVTTSSSTFHQLQSQTNYFDYHNSNHFDYAFDKDKFISKNLSQTFSDVSPLNKHQEFISLNNNNGNGNANGNMATMESTPTHSNISTVNTTESSTPTLPQLTTFHHHPSLPNLQLVNGEYDKFSNSPTPDSPIKTPVDFQKYKRKKKPFNHAYSVPHSISTSNLSASINSSPQIGLRGLGGLGGLGVSVEDDSPISSTNTPVKKYTRRRLLPRSKNGCWICRIKHLKCDESKPQCSSCVKYGISCDYSSEKPSYVTDKNLRNKKLIEITQIRKNNHKLKPKKSKKRLDD